MFSENSLHWLGQPLIMVCFNAPRIKSFDISSASDLHLSVLAFKNMSWIFRSKPSHVGFSDFFVVTLQLKWSLKIMSFQEIHINSALYLFSLSNICWSLGGALTRLFLEIKIRSLCVMYGY